MTHWKGSVYTQIRIGRDHREMGPGKGLRVIFCKTVYVQCSSVRLDLPVFVFSSSFMPLCTLITEAWLLPPALGQWQSPGPKGQELG
jgi:hypothetical protein